MPTDQFLFDPPATPAVPVAGETRLFPVRRIFCVGRNYAAHAAEMGNTVDRAAPFHFTKSAHALCPSGATIPYPAGTTDCHHEMELVVALGQGGADVAAAEAMGCVFGYACGIDLTRRDLQADAKAKGRPWDAGKDFDNSAVIAPITRAAAFGAIGDQRIRLDHDGSVALPPAGRRRPDLYRHARGCRPGAAGQRAVGRHRRAGARAPRDSGGGVTEGALAAGFGATRAR